MGRTSRGACCSGVPGLLRAAVLLSPMVPFEPEPLPSLEGTSVFIGAGRSDPIAPPAQAERLASLLGRAGAAVTIAWHEGAHGIAPDLVEQARDWLLAIASAPARPPCRAAGGLPIRE